MTLLTRQVFLWLTRLWYHSVTPGLKAKPNAHSICAQESSLHTYHTKNGYRISNVTIYSIYYRIMSLQKTKSNTLGSIAMERHHNSTSNWPGAIARLEHCIEVLQSLLQLLSSRFVWQGENSNVEYTYGWYSASAGNK
jgi:hypothetical protein